MAFEWVEPDRKQLAPIKAKLLRALQLSHVLNQIIAEHAIAPGADWLVDRLGTQMRVKVSSIRSLPYQFNLVLSESCHHLRSSLDHIAWALSEKPEDLKARRRISFPLCDNEADFKRFLKNNPLNVSPDLLREIEQLQPFHAAADVQLEFLGLLSELNNLDKHLSLVDTRATAIGTSVAYVAGNARIHTETRSFEPDPTDGTLVAVFPWDDRWDKAGIEFRATISISAAFANRTKWNTASHDVPLFINRCYELINGRILPTFQSHFRP